MAKLPGGVQGHTYTAMITIFFQGSWAFWGGSFYPSNTCTQDRTLVMGLNPTLPVDFFQFIFTTQPQLHAYITAEI